jgi:hypothetical protein
VLRFRPGSASAIRTNSGTGCMLRCGIPHQHRCATSRYSSRRGCASIAENWGRPSGRRRCWPSSGADAGACWLRLLPVGVGLASVDEEAPQLGIASEPEFQHKGLWATTHARTCGGSPSSRLPAGSSLTVHRKNAWQHTLYASAVAIRKIGARGANYQPYGSHSVGLDPGVNRTRPFNWASEARAGLGGHKALLRYGR